MGKSSMNSGLTFFTSGSSPMASTSSAVTRTRFPDELTPRDQPAPAPPPLRRTGHGGHNRRSVNQRSVHDHISNRSASTGGSSAARRAGYVEVATPITISVKSDNNPDCHDRIMPEKRSGIGARFTS